MVHVDIPGLGVLSIQHLVLDLNGTLTLDGRLLEGVRERLGALSGKVTIHVLTADTLGKARKICADLPVILEIIGRENQVEEKSRYVKGLDRGAAAIGNGRNDAGMLEKAALGIGVLGPEGACPKTLGSANVVVRDVNEGLDLLLSPDRLRATLRG